MLFAFTEEGDRRQERICPDGFLCRLVAKISVVRKSLPTFSLSIAVRRLLESQDIDSNVEIRIPVDFATDINNAISWRYVIDLHCSGPNEWPSG